MYGMRISAAAEATIRVIHEERLVENAAQIGEKLLNSLRILQKRYPGIGDVRGLGLMAGVEFVVPGSRIEDKKTGKKVQKSCIEDGLLVLTCGIYDNVVRWIPPLIINDEELDDALGIFERVLEKHAQ